MDGSQPVRVTREGDHQVVHLPADVTAPEGAVVRRDGERLIIEPARRADALQGLLATWAAEPPLSDEERLPSTPRPAPRPFRL
jgi:antitoxin VapB